MARWTVSLPLRYTFLMLELGALLLANCIAFNSWLPLSAAAGYWFYAALFGLLLGHRLDTPFFTTPKDAALYAIPALVATLQIPTHMWEISPYGEPVHWLLLGWIGFVLAVASLAIWSQSKHAGEVSKYSAVGAQLSASLGNPRAFFSVPLFLLLIAFPPPTVLGLLAIVVAWAISVPFSLLDFIAGLVRRISIAVTTGEGRFEAEVASFQVPGLIVLRSQQGGDFARGSVIAYRPSNSEVRLACVLGPSGTDGGTLTRAIDLGVAQAQKSGAASSISDLQAVAASASMLSGEQSDLANAYRDGCIGVVAPNSEIGRLMVEITADTALSAGRLVRVRCGAVDSFYQLTNGLTQEEIVQLKNTFGFVVGHAKTVGRWNAKERRFQPTTWVPTPNAAVTLVDGCRREEFDMDSIGCFPGTDFGVRLANTNHLVTHNTAILGILGVGKSMLAVELIERVIGTGCKVLALDLTDQYEAELAGLFDPSYNSAVVSALQGLTAGRDNVNLNVEEGGNRGAFAAQMEASVEAFMASEQRLLILNPASFEVWRQDSKPFSGKASMASLTSCEITQIVSESALRASQRRGRIDSARLWLVYEEAHSLVPEWNAAVADGDRAASNGTGRAILQGRKYGLGCLLITQRTASVTKTILNQCNTIFAMRSFDDTSKEFLSNYIGKDYAALLPSLPERHAVFFGRASSCENPVHIELNDRACFLAAARQNS